MKEIQIFNNNEFGQVRTITKDNEPMFCLGDLCKALDLTAKEVKRRLSDEVVIKHPITDTLGRMQETLFVNEDGMYDVILESRKESAKKFRKWVTSEVLPSIRKHGMYATEELLDNPDLLIAVATELKAEREKNKALTEANQRMKPKEIFADAVSASQTSILVGELAKILCQNGVQIGQKRLFEWLRENGYLMKTRNTSWNMPTQKSMDKGLFEIKETTITHSDGHISVNKTAKVTGKGQIYFVNKLLAEQ